jgi:hypothetical protein
MLRLTVPKKSLGIKKLFQSISAIVKITELWNNISKSGAIAFLTIIPCGRRIIHHLLNANVFPVSPVASKKDSA